jgi:hypothetical protein
MPRKNLFKHRSDDEDEDHFDYEKPKQIKTLGKLPKGVKKLSDEPQKLTPTQIKHLHNINFEKLKTSKRSGASQNPVNNNNNTKGSLRSNFKQYPFPKEAQKFLKPVKYGPKNSAANRKATIPKPPPRPDPDHPPVTRRVFARPMQNKVADRFKMPRKIMAMPNPDKVETFTNYKKRRLAETIKDSILLSRNINKQRKQGLRQQVGRRSKWSIFLPLNHCIVLNWYISNHKRQVQLILHLV